MQNDDINEFNYINGRGSLISGFLLFGVFFICIKGRFEYLYTGSGGIDGGWEDGLYKNCGIKKDVNETDDV